MTKSKKIRWALLGLLALQVPLWMLLILNVPVLIKKHTQPAFSVNVDRNCACMVLRLTGSHVWGVAISDAFCIDLDSGKLFQMPIQEHDAMMEVARVARSNRSMRLTHGGIVQILTHDPESVSGLAIQPIDFPKGKGPLLVNERYVLGADIANLYLWDDEKPDAGTQVFPKPLKFSSYFSPLPGTNLAYALLPGKPVDSPAGTPEDPDRLAAVADPFGADPFGDIPKRLVARPLVLFRIDEAVGPEFVAKWDVLAKDRDYSNVVTLAGSALVSLSTSEDAFEYRSTDTGVLISRRPIPVDFDPATMDWAFANGRIHIGSLNHGPLFDLASGTWLPNPGKEYDLMEEFQEGDLGVYWSSTNKRRLVFDHRHGAAILDVPNAQGRPVLIDDETVAICSTRFGFAVDVVELREGRTVASWMPLWWAPYLMIACLVGYALWSWVWLNHAASAHDYPTLDVAIVIGVIVSVFAFRCKWVGVAGIDDGALEQSIRGIGCAALTLSCCGLFAGKGNPVARFLVLCFVLAGVGAISRFLLDSTYAGINDEEQRTIIPSYYDTIQALCCILIPALLALSICLLLLACGIGVTLVDSVPRPVDRRMTWRIVDLCLLIAASAVLVALYSSLISASRSEVYELYGNNYFLDAWQYLAATGPVLLVVAMATLARDRMWFLLAVLLAVLAAVSVCWQPVSEFVLNTSGMAYGTGMDHMRVAAASVTAAFVICLPYRLRGWRVARRRGAGLQGCGARP